MKMFFCCCLGLLLVPVASAVETRQETDRYTIVVDAAGKTFSITAKPSGQVCVKDATLLTGGGNASAGPIHDPKFGEGQQIVIHGENGNEASIATFAKLPFVLIRGKLHNAGEKPTTTRSLDVAKLPLDSSHPIGELKIFGTGGLSDVTGAAGSYMWQAVVDPKTRHGVVAGWLTTERGSGILLPSASDGKIELTARTEYGRLLLKPGQTEPLETLAIGWFDDARDGLEAYAAAVAKGQSIKLAPQPCGYCTWYHAGASNAAKVAALSTFAAKELKPFGFSVVQIDDGWQDGEKKNGPMKNFTASRAKGPYPEGMTPTAAKISSLGLTPGLWFMPFAGTWDDPWFKEHQDWFVKHDDGKPFDTKWGGTCLDMTNDAAQTYLRDNVRRITHEWGFKYLKMDGLWTGTATEQIYINDKYKDDHIGDAVLSNPNQTNIQAFRAGLRLIREAAGGDVFLLGCCAPQNMRSYGGAFGLLDGMRIGPDNSPSPGGLLRGPRYGSRNYFLNGRVWWNDPDPVYVRTSLSRSQAELSVAWAGVTGQLTIASDEFEKLPPDRLDLLKRVTPAHGRMAHPVDLFDRDIPRAWVVPAGDTQPGLTLVGLFNWDQEPLAFDESLERLGLDSKREYAAFEFWTNALTEPMKEHLRWKLSPLGKDAAAEKDAPSTAHSCAVLAIRPIVDHPQLISTSRHVSQGLVDVVSENWDAGKNELAGESRVVGGDTYELRILTRSTAGPWKHVGVELSPTDREAGVTITSKSIATSTSKEEKDLVRVTIQSPVSGDLKWSVRFAR